MLNLVNGEKVWKYDINAKGIPYPLPVNDSTVIIIGGGIHSFNINSGLKWKYDIKIPPRKKKEKREFFVPSSIYGGSFLTGAIGGALISLMQHSIEREAEGYPFTAELKNDTLYYESAKDKVLLLTDGELIERHEYKEEKNKSSDGKKEDKGQDVQGIRYRDYTFEEGEKNMTVYNSSNEKIAELDIDRIVLCEKGFVYGTRKNFLYKISLELLSE